MSSGTVTVNNTTITGTLQGGSPISGNLNLSSTAISGTLTVDETVVSGTVNISSPTINGTMSGGQLVSGEVNTSVIEITGVYGSTDSVPPSVLAHISRTDNPHGVEESQLVNGPDYVVIFDNILSQG